MRNVALLASLLMLTGCGRVHYNVFDASKDGTDASVTDSSLTDSGSADANSFDAGVDMAFDAEVDASPPMDFGVDMTIDLDIDAGPPPGVVISPTLGLVTTELGGSAEFTLALASPPTADVTIAIASDNTAEGTVDRASVTFTSSTWNVPQTVSVTGVDDDLVDGDTNFAIVTGSSSSADARYEGLDVDDVTVTNRTSFRQQAYVKASNPDVNDFFGNALALSGDGNTLVVAAPSEASGASGIDGNQSDNSEASAGAIYVFRRTGATWAQEAYLKASNSDAGDYFGWAVAISNDGNTIAVGAQSDSSAGSAYVFRFAAGAWSEQARIQAMPTGLGDLFGSSVSLSSDGNTLAVGAIGEDSVATGVNGNALDNSAGQSGAVYVFRYSGSWSQQAYIKASNTDASDTFGTDLALSSNGNVLAVTAPAERSHATGINGDELDDSFTYAGAVYVFRFAGSWSQEAYVKASNTDDLDAFGLSVALSGDGNTLAVGAYWEDSDARTVGGDETNNLAMNSGAAYLFRYSASSWVQQAYFKSSNSNVNDGFGGASALSFDGNVLAISSTGEASNATGVNGDQSDNSRTESGAVYVFAFASSWSQALYVKSSNGDIYDHFGGQIGMSADGHTLACSAPSESSAATGVDGVQSDNSVMNSGAAYVFTN